MKQGLVRSKDQFQNLADDGQVTADEYAQDKVKYWSEDAVHDVAHGSKETTKKTYDGGKKLVRQIKQKQRNAGKPQPGDALQPFPQRAAEHHADPEKLQNAEAHRQADPRGHERNGQAEAEQHEAAAQALFRMQGQHP